MNGWSWLMLYNFLNPLKQATSGLSHKPGTSSSQPRYTAWLHLGIARPNTSSSHLTLFYSSGRVALGKTQVGADLGLHHPGSPRAWAPSGQLQTTSENHHPAPAHLIIHCGWRSVASGHSQSLQLTILGTSLPLTCHQQLRLNYKRKGYSAHMKVAPWVSSLGDRGGCATGPYRTRTTLSHVSKTGNHSNST